MKLVIIIMTTCLMQVSASTFAQKITLNQKDVALEQVLKQIRIQSGYKFIYDLDLLKKAKPVTVNIKSASVEETLDAVLKDQQIIFEIKDKTIILDIKEKSFFDKISNVIQNLSKDNVDIIGTVLDKDSQPLPGATVKVKNKKQVAITSENGTFFLKLDINDVLIFSYTGYKTQEVLVSKLPKPIVIKMEPSIGSLDELQVIGYGTVSRKLNTGSVSSISAEQIEKQTVDNPIQALAGRIPGMTVVQSNGLPGSNSTVNIRGNNTLGSNGLSGSLPLYIIDGVPLTNLSAQVPITDNLNSAGLTGANGGLSIFGFISPQDIERIDVLKDADATAIYGSRGANGVILITTKQGKRGKSTLNANIYQGAGKVGHFVDMLNTEQYLTLRKEAFNNGGITPTAINAPDLVTWDQNAYTNWQKLLIGGTANVTDASVSYTGGNERVKFLTSANYRREGTVFPGSMGSNRLNGRINVSTNSADNKFTTQFSVNYANDNTNLISQDLSSLLSLPPNNPLYNPDGTLYWFGTKTNPIAYLNRVYNNNSSNFIANGNLQYNIIKGLSFKTNLGYTRTTVIQNSQNPISSQNPTSTLINSASFANLLSTNYIIEPQLNYNLSVKKHSFTALLGSTLQQNVSDENVYNGSNYPFQAMLNSLTGAGTITTSENYSDYKYASAFGRFNYNYNDKYLLNMSFRRDASSRFGPNKQIADFGAIGAAWLFSEESYLKDKFSFFSFGKIRASYGITGNDEIPNYQYLTLFGVGAVYRGQATLATTSLANPDLHWETTKKLDFGLDLGFFQDRLSFKADIYRDRSSDLLTYQSIPTASGFNTINTNLDAVVQNAGLEFELSSTNISVGDFSWSSAFNISFQRSKVLSFPDQSTAFYGASYVVGYPANLQRYYSYTGIDPNTGVALYADLDGSGGPLDPIKDKYIYGIGNPYFGGFDNTFSYKAFSLNVFFQFNHSMGFINQVYGSTIGSMYNQNVSALSRWTKPGDTGTLFPGAAVVSGAIYNSWTNLSQSDFYYGDASWIKLRSANLSYNLPKEWIGHIKMRSAKVYVQGQNLLTFSKNKYVLDPETPYSLPPLRTIVLGANLTF